jgi:hypothetical protein
MGTISVAVVSDSAVLVEILAVEVMGVSAGGVQAAKTEIIIKKRANSFRGVAFVFRSLRARSHELRDFIESSKCCNF